MRRLVLGILVRNRILLTTSTKRDAAAENNIFKGGKMQKSYMNTFEFTTQIAMATAVTPSSNGDADKDRPLREGDHLKPASEHPNNGSPCTKYDDEDKYFITIENGMMKVMPTTSLCPKMNRNGILSASKDSITTKSPTKNTVGESRTAIPETVLQFQRQLRKTQAAKRASTPLPKSQLKISYNDEHIVVVNKPSGVLTVPGINNNPSMLSLLHEIYKQELDPEMKAEHMIVHRLDMDTSGIVIYAKSKTALLRLQASFRERDQVSKYYEAVVCGHLHPEVERGIIDLPLQRDHRFPPFMRVATPRSEREAQEVARDLKKAGWKKIVKKRAKPSQTLFEVIAREYRSCDEVGFFKRKEKSANSNKQRGNRYPVTRLRLTLKTGRTHQLRVHCASIGHPILGDPAYGIYGEASKNGGFEDDLMDELNPNRATLELQLALDRYVKEKDQVMCLHAQKLRIQHPITGAAMVFEQPPAF